MSERSSSALRQRGPAIAATFAIVVSGMALSPGSTAQAVPVSVEFPVSPVEDGTGIDPGPLPENSRPSLPQTRSTPSKAASQCQYGLFASFDRDAEDAANIMRGYARVGQFGTFRLKKNPTWRYTSSLDNSGNGNMHALFWALPLLRHGLRTGNTAMVNRFYALLFDWIKDNPPKKPRQGVAYGQIEMGWRMTAMACGLAGPTPQRNKLMKALRVQANVAKSRWRNVNNVSFIQAGGIFSAGCAVGNKKLRNVGLSYMSKSISKMVARDGSVREGSLIYGRNTYKWTQQQIARIRGCGVGIPNELLRVNKTPEFLAHGLRPDRRYEALGDGSPVRVDVDDTLPGSSFRYMATRGAEGTVPANAYSTWDAGFIFGHSAFGQTRRFADETYYSIRTGPGHDTEYHAHSDAAALTLASRGSQLLYDTGQYRYQRDAASSFIYSRAAHNNVSLDGRSASAPRPNVVTARSDAEGDLTSIIDPAYSGTGLQRTIWYDRQGDYFIVMDDISMDRVGTFYLNWNFGRDRSVVINEQSAHTTGPEANVSVMNIGNAVSYTVGAGERSPYRGWNSSEYGELVPSPTLRAHAWGPANRIVTVIVPRDSGVEASSTSATGLLTPTGAQVETTIAGQTYRIDLSSTAAVRLPEPTELR